MTQCELPLIAQICIYIVAFTVPILVFYSIAWVTYYAGYGYISHKRDKETKQ